MPLLRKISQTRFELEDLFTRCGYGELTNALVSLSSRRPPMLEGTLGVLRFRAQRLFETET